MKPEWKVESHETCQEHVSLQNHKKIVLKQLFFIFFQVLHY